MILPSPFGMLEVVDPVVVHLATHEFVEATDVVDLVAHPRQSPATGRHGHFGADAPAIRRDVIDPHRILHQPRVDTDTVSGEPDAGVDQFHGGMRTVLDAAVRRVGDLGDGCPGIGRRIVLLVKGLLLEVLHKTVEPEELAAVLDHCPLRPYVSPPLQGRPVVEGPAPDVALREEFQVGFLHGNLLAPRRLQAARHVYPIVENRCTCAPSPPDEGSVFLPRTA